MASKKRLRQKRDSVTQNQVVYFLHDARNGEVKVGYTSNLPRRMAAYRTHSAGRLDLLGTVPGGEEEEGRIHGLLSEYRIPGKKEWFEASEDVLRTCRHLCIRKGSPRTVQDELTRRKGCRYGLEDVEVAVRGHWLARWAVYGSKWDRNGNLVLKLRPWGATPCDEVIVDSNGNRLGKPFGDSWCYSLRDLVEGRVIEPDDCLKNVPAESCFLMSEWPIVCPCWLPERGE